MNDLVYLKTEEAMTDSLTVAESFGKRHDRVIRAIENLSADLPKNGAVKFIQSRYKDAKGEFRKRYLMNRDGFSLLVMGFNGKKALEWKLKYIDAFNKMESVLTEKRTADWIETRRRGKLTRKEETDTIKDLVEYAKQQGSTNSDKLYMVYSRLANKFAGIETRDTASVAELNLLSIYENIALHIMQNGMECGMHYKDIYQKTKERFAQAKELAFLEG